jgi:hypothetical protein
MTNKEILKSLNEKITAASISLAYLKRSRASFLSVISDEPTDTEEPEMTVNKPEFYDKLQGDETMYNVTENEISTRWADTLSEFIDKLGGDSPALWEWNGITPTPEKVVECLQELFDFHMQIATDGELDECCRILEINGYFEHRDMLLKYRRPQPTLKSQALKDLETVRKNSDIIPEILETIEKALKSIPE